MGVLHQDQWQAHCVYNVLEEIEAQLQGRQVRMFNVLSKLFLSYVNQHSLDNN